MAVHSPESRCPNESLRISRGFFRQLLSCSLPTLRLCPPSELRTQPGSLALTRGPARESSLRHGAPPPGWPFGKRGNSARRAPPSSVPLRRADADPARGRLHSARAFAATRSLRNRI